MAFIRKIRTGFLHKIRFSISVRLSLVYSLVFVVVVALIYLAVVPKLENNLTSQKESELGNYASLFSESFLSAQNQGASLIYLDHLVQQFSVTADARILFMDGSGNLLADSQNGQSFDSNDYSISKRAINHRGPLTDVVTQSNNQKYVMAAVPVASSNRIVGVIVVSQSLAGVQSAVSLVQRLLGIAAGLALVLALISTYLVSHFLARRVRRIEAGAVQIAKGDFATRVPVKSQDELGQLARTFNDMGDKLGAAFQRIDVEKRRAKLLLDDLSEGVIGIDTSGNIIVANPAAESLLGKTIEPPVALQGCVPEEIFDLWDSMSVNSPQREDTFLLGSGQALAVHSSYLSDQAELASLLVLRDVSQEVKLEQSRRDFIANASHELKTPIFSLGGFLEILQDEEVDENTKREFVATMREQVDRLANLARDLLDLSRMDSGAMSVQAGNVELNEVISSVAREFSARQVSGDARVDLDGLPAGLTACCDRDRTAQLVRILIDNALKYSPANTRVRVSGRNGNGASVSFTVADEGPGIPHDEIGRIFERFYRGHGAGRIRGTGLGLSIAREIVRLMDGSISVESAGRGSSFTVTLPANGKGGAAPGRALTLLNLS
ncbi:MAG: sensor histidine kinase [Thermoleophilia bacterium]